MISRNIADVKKRISSACARRGVVPEDITVIAVVKNVNEDLIQEAVGLGLNNLGENRVQEAKELYLAHPRWHKSVKWHLIGHLQTNKAKEAVEIFDLIHSVDSLKLAVEINKRANRINKIQDILLQVNPALGINPTGKETKFGLKPTDVFEVIQEIRLLKNLNLKGLMTIAPEVDKLESSGAASDSRSHNPENVRLYFRALREIKDKTGGLEILSMGMSGDFEVAIEEGANMVRVGRAIFKE